jgi:NAD(P)-dependent dehydrogenase (short-subunit alcohol dehydrogenase family)
VYDCAKAGLNAMTVAIADPYGPSVRVSCIMPGLSLPISLLPGPLR